MVYEQGPGRVSHLRKGDVVCIKLRDGRLRFNYRDEVMIADKVSTLMASRQNS